MTDPQSHWQSQEVDMSLLSIEDIKARSARFANQIKWRNRREYAAGAFVLLGFSWYVWSLVEPLMKLGSALMIAGVVFVLCHLYARSSYQDPDAEARDIVSSYRSRLERERKLLRSVPLWYLAPMVPGFAVFMFGKARVMAPINELWLLLNVGVPVLVLAGVVWLNFWGARKLAAQLNALGRDNR